MTIDAGALTLRARADTSQLQADMTAGASKAGAAAAATMSTTLSAGLKKAGASISRTGRTLTRGLTLPLVGLGVVATKFALDYDKAFTQIAATTNTSQKQVAAWRKEVLTLSGETARAPEELANALYFLASAGLDTAQIMPVLEASAKAAASGLGETQDIARLTANVLNAFPKSGLKAADVIDTLVGAVREGSAAPDEFASAMGRILPIAAEADVGFDQLAASLATVSNIGLDVNEGVTAMRGLLQALTAPTAQSTDALKDLGLSADDVRASLEDDGLLATLDLLDEKSHGQIETLQDLIPNVRSLTGFFGLQGQEAAKVDAIFESLTDSTGSLNKAFDTTAKSDSFKFDQAMNRLRIAGIRLGNQLIPILVDDVLPVIQDVVHGFSGLSPEMKEFAIKAGLAAAVAGPLLRLAGSLTSMAGGLAKVVPLLLKWAGIGSFPVPSAAALAAAGFGAGGLPPGAAAFGRTPTQFGPPGLVTPLGTPGGFATTSALGATGAGAARVPFAPFNVQLQLKDLELLDLELGAFQRTLDGATPSAEGLAAATDFLNQQLAESGSAIKANGLAVQYALENNVSYSEAIQQVGGAFSIASAALREQFTPALQRGQNITARQQQRLAGLVNQVGALGGSLDATTVQMVGNVLAMGDSQAAGRVLKDVITDLRASHDEAAGAAKNEATQVEDLGNKFGAIPRQVSTKITAPGLAEANRGVDDLASSLNGLPSTKVINIQLNREQWPGHAMGGYFPHRPSGYPIVVGEGRHDEWVVNRPQMNALVDRARGGQRGMVLEGPAVIKIDGVGELTGTIRAVARQEINGEARWRATGARAGR